jgi:hypothetical protein
MDLDVRLLLDMFFSFSHLFSSSPVATGEDTLFLSLCHQLPALRGAILMNSSPSPLPLLVVSLT